MKQTRMVLPIVRKDFLPADLWMPVSSPVLCLPSWCAVVF